MLQHATGHHTDGALFHKRFEDFPQCHRHPCPSFTGSLLLARGTTLPKNSSTLEGLRVKARISSKKVWRRASTRRSKAYFSSLHVKTVWNKKARRLRLSRNAERYCWPWPKWCSRWYPLVLSTLLFSFSIFQRPRPAWATAAMLSALRR